jgi:sigma-B regulation protein RsbQ
MKSDKSAFHEFAAFVNPAAVTGSDLIPVAGANIGLEHYGGVRGLDDMAGRILGTAESAVGKFGAKYAGTGLVFLHRANEILHAGSILALMVLKGEALAKMSVMKLLLGIILALPMSAAAVDGAKVHWTSAGSGKQAVILVHGWTCDETSWDAQVPALSGKYRVIRLDLPGHGKSDPPKDGKFSMTMFARAVEAVRAEAKAGKAVLVGHSMGTPVIREYAHLYPQNVAGLVAVDGLLLVGGSGRGAPNPAAMTGPEGMKARETMIRGMFTPSTSAAVEQHVLKMMLAAPEATAAGAMQATFDASSFNDEVATVPVLGIYAGANPMANRVTLKKLFPNSEYVQVAGTGHFVMMERPEEFNRLLLAFLAKVKY